MSRRRKHSPQKQPQAQPTTDLVKESTNASGQALAVPSWDDKAFGLAVEEYKIVQSKIDKIGDFCLKVKGWSLTITAAIVAGTATSKVPWWFAFGAAATTLLFKIGDDYQSSLRSVLSARAMDIERYFHSIDKKLPLEKRVLLPFLANAITDKWKQQRRSRLALLPDAFSFAGIGSVIRHNWEYFAWRSDPMFYYGQLIFVLCATLLIGKYGRPAPSAFELQVTSTLSALTNSPLWKADLRTNYVIPTNPPIVLNTIVVTNHASSNIINVSVPVTVTNTVILPNRTEPSLISTNSNAK